VEERKWRGRTKDGGEEELGEKGKDIAERGRKGEKPHLDSHSRFVRPSIANDGWSNAAEDPDVPLHLSNLIVGLLAQDPLLTQLELQPLRYLLGRLHPLLWRPEVKSKRIRRDSAR
jgi:hypothetical protein